MYPNRIITLLPIVSLSLGHLVTVEEPEQPSWVSLPFSQHEDMVPSYTLPDERSSCEILFPRATLEQAEAVGQPYQATTVQESSSPSLDALRGRDVSDRVSALEESIEQVENAQRTASTATALLGVALLGVVATRLRRLWPGGRARSSFEDAEAADSSVKEVSYTATHVSPKQPAGTGSPQTDHRQSRTPTSACEVLPSSSGIPLATVEPREGDAPAQADPDAAQNRDERQKIPEPVDAVRSLTNSINDLRPPSEVSLADKAWCVGFSRHIGPRDNQEDYVLAFQVGDVRVCLLADGAGGHPLGEYASYHGIIGAAASLARILAFASEDGKPELEKAARQAIRDASYAIALHASMTGIPQGASLRSTLIVLLATDEEFAWANLGDGGGWTIRAAPREYDSFLVPAKGEQPHHLTSSLGPAIHGDISSGSKPWGDADFLVIASDGVADVIDVEPFFDTCLATCLQRQGKLSEAAEAMLQLLVESPDVTDNVSLGFVGRCRKPVLAM